MSSAGAPDVTSKPLEEVFADRLRFEHEVIGHRITWLMTLNSFLIGAAAVLTANKDKFSGTYGLTGAFLVLAVLGIVSNASCLFSNYWATKAINEAGQALDETWRELPSLAREQRRRRMRLYGRDPRAFHSSAVPPSQVLHPWLLLPGTFLLFSLVLPFASHGLSSVDLNVAVPWLVLAVALVLAPFVVLPLLDIRQHKRAGR